MPNAVRSSAFVLVSALVAAAALSCGGTGDATGFNGEPGGAAGSDNGQAATGGTGGASGAGGTGGAGGASGASGSMGGASGAGGLSGSGGSSVLDGSADAPSSDGASGGASGMDAGNLDAVEVPDQGGQGNDAPSSDMDATGPNPDGNASDSGAAAGNGGNSGSGGAGGDTAGSAGAGGIVGGSGGSGGSDAGTLPGPDADLDAPSTADSGAADAANDTNGGSADSGCTSGLTQCGNTCTDTLTDTSNCGGCGSICTIANGNAACVNGACTVGGCKSGFDDCDHDATNGCEVNLQTDPSNCNTCGNACTSAGGTPGCVAGVCGISSCSAGLGDCNGNAGDGCETDITASPTDCGQCGKACAPANGNGACVGGNCNITGCLTGFASCDNNDANGCETDTQSSTAHCGGCNQACTNDHGTFACVNGACNPSCSTGFLSCDNNPANGCETAVLADSSHCGACDVVCPVGTACQGGVCACPGGQLVCGGTCTTVASDPTNCGGCGNVCSSNHITAQACTTGMCNGNCAAHFGDCNGNKLADGCETDLNSSLTNCSACGAACSTNHIVTACDTGSCDGTCMPNYRDCNNNKRSDGCEINIATNPSRCGSCTYSCSGTNVGTRACTNGVCTPTCATNYGDCDAASNTNNGCETFLYNNDNNCGKCGNACGIGATCVGTQCLFDNGHSCYVDSECGSGHCCTGAPIYRYCSPVAGGC